MSNGYYATYKFTATEDCIVEVFYYGLSNNGGEGSLTSTGTKLWYKAIGTYVNSYYGGGGFNGVYKLTARQTVSVYVKINTNGGDHAHGGCLVMYEY